MATTRSSWHSSDSPIANIAAEEFSHIEIVSYTINLLLTGATKRGSDPTATPLASALDARNSYHFIASGQQALPMDSQGNFWTGQHVFSSGNLKLDLLHNFFLECGARTRGPVRRGAGLHCALLVLTDLTMGRTMWDG